MNPLGVVCFALFTALAGSFPIHAQSTAAVARADESRGCENIAESTRHTRPHAATTGDNVPSADDHCASEAAPPAHDKSKAPVAPDTATTAGSVGTASDNRTWNGVITNLGKSRRTSTICQFLSGPKAHGWHDYAPFPPVPVESTCEDGAGSAGIVLPSGHGDRY